MTSISALIAPLFVPGHRSELIPKAIASGADAVIIDLEDGVPRDAKDFARAEIAKLDLPASVIVRVNGITSDAHAADCAALVGLPITGILLPKTERIEHIVQVARIAPVIGLIETAAGLANVRAIARSGASARLAFGSIDYAVDLGCEHAHEPLLSARSEMVLASRLGGLPPPLDGVTTNIAAPEIAEEDARISQRLGFGGKLLIHPAQVAPTLRGFRPSRDEIQWARRVIDGTDGAVRIDGMMIDEPVRVRAREILRRSDR